MTRTIKTVDVIDYFDVPLLFVGKDPIGTHYLCMIIDNSPSFDKYICVPISEKRLSEFYVKKVGVKTIFLEPEINSYFFYTVDSNCDNPLVECDFNPKYMPEEDFYYQNSISEERNKIFIKSKSLQAALFTVNLSDSGDLDSHSIDTQSLVALLHTVPNLLKNALTKAIETVKGVYEYPSYRVLALEKGSFEVCFIGSGCDMYGHSNSKYAFEKIDEITKALLSGDDFIPELKKNKGKLAFHYIKMMELAVTKKCHIEYSWVTPDATTTKSFKLTNDVVEKAYKKIQALGEDLITNDVEIKGVLQAINIKKNYWELKDDKKTVKGYVKDKNITLKGTVNGERYKFSCLVEYGTDPITGKEKETYILREPPVRIP